VRRTVPAAVTLLALATVAPGTAHAAAGPGEGLACGFTTLSNPFAAPGRQVGLFEGGPLVVADGTDPRAGRIRCTIQLDAIRHDGPDAAVVESVTTPGVVAFPPTAFEYGAEPFQEVVLCQQVEIAGAGTFYWDADARAWSASASVPCDLVLAAPADEPLTDTVWFDVVDPVLCPALAAASPGTGPVTVSPEGDVAAADAQRWDCPPYEEAP
jgi:hypothetical protein